jgi:hypothetical protein
MKIRWLGAYKAGASLYEALRYEFSANDEVCAMDSRDQKPHWAKVGLVMKNKSVFKRHNGDVWSVRENGMLTATHKAVATHREYWCRNGAKNIIAVIVELPISEKAFGELIRFVEETGVNVYNTKTGKVVKGLNPTYKVF